MFEGPYVDFFGHSGIRTDGKARGPCAPRAKKSKKKKKKRMYPESMFALKSSLV